MITAVQQKNSIHHGVDKYCRHCKSELARVDLISIPEAIFYDILGKPKDSIIIIGFGAKRRILWELWGLLNHIESNQTLSNKFRSLLLEPDHERADLVSDNEKLVGDNHTIYIPVSSQSNYSICYSNINDLKTMSSQSPPCTRQYWMIQWRSLI